jgi:required for meiotic nuclear division protein 1
MSKEYKVLSFQICDSIDIKSFKGAFSAELIYSDSDELFFQIGPAQYIYVFKYGVVCFLNHDDFKISEFFKLISPHCKNFFEYKLREEYLIETNANENKIGNNKIELINADTEICRIVMLNVSQSVALDYYSDQVTILLEETNKHTFSLEKTGKLNISGNRLLRFIGRTLNLMNRITENLYIFDSAPSTWEDESLDRIDIELKKTFDLQSRYRSIHEELQIIKENFDLFKDIMQHRNSNLLEWIIIVLILAEVINLFLSKLLEKI